MGTIILLSNNVNSLSLLKWLEQRANVIYYNDRLSVDIVEQIKPDLVISYNYRFIIKTDVIVALRGKIINLHISLLPWNRGSSPNLWSIIDNTPKGVTIHILDEGLDTGDILFQRELFFDENKETLSSSYEKLNSEIVKLLQDNWRCIWHKKWQPSPQGKGGSCHNMKDLQDFLNGRTFSYDMTIAEFKRDFGAR